MKQSSVIKLAFRQKVPKPPQSLEKAGRRLWKSIQAEYSITDPGGLAFLTSASRAEDDIIRWRATVAMDGDIIVIPEKPSVPHPLIAAIRGAETTKRQSLRSLNLDVEPLHGHPGRPGGK
jgi:hypothetical protein